MYTQVNLGLKKFGGHLEHVYFLVMGFGLFAEALCHLQNH